MYCNFPKQHVFCVSARERGGGKLVKHSQSRHTAKKPSYPVSISNKWVAPDLGFHLHIFVPFSSLLTPKNSSILTPSPHHVQQVLIFFPFPPILASISFIYPMTLFSILRFFGCFVCFGEETDKDKIKKKEGFFFVVCRCSLVW